jgi:2-phospho-L-lactate/phosphoenolpyruvate guanylyltransferase
MASRVIIPVKPFGEAKQRLAPALSPVERAQLAEQMFRHVFRTAAAVFGAPNILVTSRSRDVLAIAESLDAAGLVESGPANLNAALSQAAHFLNASGESMFFVLASDLPLLESSDLREMARNDCAIAPDRHERGTNALLWPSHLPLEFGDNSFARHHAAAENAGFIPQIIRRRGIAHDVDVPTDLTDLGLHPNWARSSGSTRSA